MSIYKNVAFGLKLNNFKGDYDERVEKALRGAALWDEVKDKLQHERALARPVASSSACASRVPSRSSPSCCLMDEPCSALDPIATRRVEDLMLELKEKYTIAIVTHNLQQAQRVADRTAFMFVDTSAGGRTGYLIEYRPSAELFERSARRAHESLHSR